MNSDPGMRKLPCGCWERWIHGSSGVAEFKGWVTVLPCKDHK